MYPSLSEILTGYKMNKSKLSEIKEDFNGGGYQDYYKWKMNIEFLIKNLDSTLEQNKIMKEALEYARYKIAERGEAGLNLNINGNVCGKIEQALLEVAVLDKV